MKRRLSCAAYTNGFGVLAVGLDTFILRTAATYRRSEIVLWENIGQMVHAVTTTTLF